MTLDVGAISAHQPLAVEAGFDVLMRGGNAVDAAVAAALVQGVVDPHNGGIGGMGVAILYSARDRRLHHVGFPSVVPAAAAEDMFTPNPAGAHWYGMYPTVDHRNEVGALSVCVPGSVRGFGYLVEQFGTMPWSGVVQPAAQLARDGVPVSPHVHRLWSAPAFAGHLSELEKLQSTPASGRLFTRAGEALPIGAVMHLTEYADTLERLAVAGPDDFYTGEIARRVVSGLQHLGGILSEADLANYTVRIEEPIVTRFNEWNVASVPPPDSGATLLQMLRIAEKAVVASEDPLGPRFIAILAGIMNSGLRERRLTLADSSEARAALLAAMEDQAIAAAADAVIGGQAFQSDSLPGWQLASTLPDTSHVSVVDRAGNLVALTHTNGTNSGVVLDGLGFPLNAAMFMLDPSPGRPNSIRPRAARISAMAPTILQHADGAGYAVGGTGAYAIMTSALQVIVMMCAFGAPPLAAVSLPRIHAENGHVHVEARIPRASLSSLRQMGVHFIERPESYGGEFAGYVHVAGVDGVGRVAGAADPRKDGVALPFRAWGVA